MDVSTTPCDEKFIVKQGVLIEFGLVIYWRGIEYVYLFCNEDIDRDRLPPLIPRVEVVQYDSSDSEALRVLIRTAISTFENELPERERNFKQQSIAALSLLGS